MSTGLYHVEHYFLVMKQHAVCVTVPKKPQRSTALNMSDKRMLAARRARWGGAAISRAVL